MKSNLYDSKGNKKSSIDLPALFSSDVREDIVAKYFEAEKEAQPYATFEEAGKRHSASGRIFRRRHKWRGSYGRGISRVPRKTMWRRGTQFYWIGAEVSPMRGGRVAHPPRAFKREKKINEKEIHIAMNSAFASTTDKKFILKRYSTLKEIDAPYVIESLPEKTSQAIESLKKIFGTAFELILKKKTVRPGKGKLRGRKYKSNAGLLVLTGKDEKVKLTGVDVLPVKEATIADLYPLGRLTIYTKKAIEELEASK